MYKRQAPGQGPDRRVSPAFGRDYGYPAFADAAPPVYDRRHGGGLSLIHILVPASDEDFLDKVLPSFFMLHKIAGAFLSGNVIMPDNVLFLEIKILSQPPGQLHQSGVSLRRKRAALIRMAALDGNRVIIAVV